VREHLEQVAAFDEPQQFREVVPHDVVIGHRSEQRVRGQELSLIGHRVQGSEHAVEGLAAHDRARAGGEQVRLARLHARQHAQPRIALPALRDCG